MNRPSYDALLLVSFGGPEGPEQVLPFLENVLRGRSVPANRLQEVAQHYQHFGGVSPINEQNRALIRALEAELAGHGIRLPIYWGNRNWHPLLPETIGCMAADGIRRALALVTSAFGSYSGCLQYRQNLAEACARVGPAAPQIDKIRLFYNHPGFIEAVADRTREALAGVSGPVELIFTAHSIPVAMAQTAPYEQQLREACGLIGAQLGHPWRLAYQSRSGPPNQPWLGPDVADALRELAGRPAPPGVVLVPIGFVSDHMEVIYDLDVEMARLGAQLGLNVVRAATVGTHPCFVAALCELIEERLRESAARRAVGAAGPWPDICPAGCCEIPLRRAE